MVSKGWKVGALAVIAAISLSACQKSKKNPESQSQFRGTWINVEAKQELTRFANTADTRICQVVLENPVHFGVSVDWDNSVSLDAWSINSKGDVLRFSSQPDSSVYGTGYRSPDYMGKIAGNDFTHTNASLGLALVPPSSRGGAGCYQAPFARGNVRVSMHGPLMVAGAPRIGYKRYIKVTRDELDLLNQAISRCGDILAQRLRQGCFMNSRQLPHVEQAPPAPGHFRRPLGPGISEEEQR